MWGTHAFRHEDVTTWLSSVVGVDLVARSAEKIVTDPSSSIIIYYTVA